MAEEAKKKSDAAAAAAASDKKKDDAGKAAGAGGLLTKTPVLLAGVMILEAAVLFAGFKFLGSGPKVSAGAELIADAHGGGGDKGGEHGDGGKSTGPTDKKTPVEINVVEFRAPNKQSGRTFVYDVSIFAVAKQENEEKVKGAIDKRSRLIQDRVRTIIAQSDPEKLGGGSEPGLETLRRQVKYQLDEIVGEGLIEEVLVPRCIPFRADY
jgi:flagellar basal body-associated protein FliL